MYLVKCVLALAKVRLKPSLELVLLPVIGKGMRQLLATSHTVGIRRNLKSDVIIGAIFANLKKCPFNALVMVGASLAFFGFFCDFGASNVKATTLEPFGLCDFLIRTLSIDVNGLNQKSATSTL